MTNGDRIRQMSNEELAIEIGGNCEYCKYMYEGTCDSDSIGDTCKEGIKAYLDTEVKE